MAPRSSRSRDTVAWVAMTPSVGEQLDELRLAGHARVLEQARDAVLPLGLCRACRSRSLMTSQSRQQAPLRVHAVLRLRPHAALRAVDDLGGDLLAPVGGQAVQEDRASGAALLMQRVVDREALRTPAGAPSASASWPIDVHTSV